MQILYDMMNASFSAPRFEAGGAARIGDPLDLIGAGSAGLAGVSDVPEPAPYVLLSVGLVLIAAARQRRRQIAG